MTGMHADMKLAYLLAAFAPLAGAIIAGLFGRAIGRTASHWATITGVAASCGASFWTLVDVLAGNTFNGTLYEWAVIGDVRLEVGFLIDTLTATMIAAAIGIFALAWLHGILAGSDSVALEGAYIGMGLAVLLAAAYRYWASKRARPTFSTRTMEVDA